MFNIAFESAGAAPTDVETVGKITIADHWETFTASHTVWDRTRYERQWREAADRVLAGHPGCFVIDLASAQADYRGECWIAWPEGNVAVIQNHLLVGSDGRDFDPNDPNAFPSAVPQRLTQEGHRVSTWHVRLANVAAWRQRQASA
jgi:CdiI N-terminal domain